jgi:hypothetical protein
MISADEIDVAVSSEAKTNVSFLIYFFESDVSNQKKPKMKKYFE